MMKQLSAILLTLALLLTLMPAAVLADEAQASDLECYAEDVPYMETDASDADGQDYSEEASEEIAEEASEEAELQYEDSAAAETTAASSMAALTTAEANAYRSFLKNRSNYALKGYTATGYTYLKLSNYGGQDGMLSDNFLVIIYKQNNAAGYNDQRARIYGYSTSSRTVINDDDGQMIGPAYAIYYSPAQLSLVVFSCTSMGYQTGIYSYWNAAAQNCCITKMSLEKKVNTSTGAYSYYYRNPNSGKSSAISASSFNNYMNDLRSLTLLNPNLDSPFADVQNTASYYYKPVLWAVNAGITTGTTATTFSPYNTCTRAQIITFLWRAAGSPEPKSTKNPYTDVKQGAYYKAILWAAQQGIADTSSTTFGVNEPCTRILAVTYMYRAAGSPSVNTSSNPFTDVTSSADKQAVVWAVNAGVTKGTTATTFSPSDTCIRAQIVTFLYRYAS